MRASPLVSVIIAVYNREDFLRDSVVSVINQSLTDIEILIVDDGSSDSTAEVARLLTCVDSRVHLLRLKQNCGPSAARNLALDQARGEYIAILDADDICMQDRLYKQVNFLRDTGIDLCGSWFIEFGMGMSRTIRWPYTEQALRAAMLFQYSILHPSILAKRKVFEKYRYNSELRLAEDYDLCVRAMGEFRIANIPEALTRYRRHPKQATMTQRKKMEEITQRIRLEALSLLPIEASEDEQYTHNQIRAPQSICSLEELDKIELWLLKLVDHFDHPDAKHAVATQWIRAAVRAAPLGFKMLSKYKKSPLHELLEARGVNDLDISILAISRLEYSSPAFNFLRRFGLGL